MRDSSTPRRSGKGVRPRKPRPDFPLFPHAAGYWAKKVRGKLIYFGKWSDDPTGQRALELWAEAKDDLLAGRVPRGNKDGLTVADLVNRFLSYKLARVESGELTQPTWNEYHATCGTVVQQFGRNRLVADLDSADFEALRSTFAKTVGPVRLGKLVQISRSVFKYAFDAGLIDQPVRYGPAFTRPSKSVLRRHRAEQGPKLFSPSEIVALLEAATPTMRAFVLLACNAALGNADCGRLEFRHLDLTQKDGWGMLDYPRGKTGIARRSALWPETCRAIEAAVAVRKPPADPAHSELVFTTVRGGPWEKATSDKPVSKEFAKLCKAVGIKRKGATFYALRHTARTVLDATGDFPAIDLLMGHAREDMASVYRETIADSRLRVIAEYLRGWLWPNADEAQTDQTTALRVVG